MHKLPNLCGRVQSATDIVSGTDQLVLCDVGPHVVSDYVEGDRLCQNVVS